MTKTKQKIQLILLIILISFLGVSIFVLFNNAQQIEKTEEPIVERVIFKENGITSDELYLADHSIDEVTNQTLNKLHILNDDVSWLDGLPLEINGREKIPLAVMIENYPDAWTQTVGLDKAKIVYEALVEGGFTRYLAVFDPTNVPKIGPVRSARPYFIHWAEEFAGAYIHIGGSDEALAYLRNSSKVINVDENEGEDVIWRDDDYFAPHDAFTSTNNLYAKIENYNWNKSLKENFFKFKLKEYPVENPIQKISINFSIPIYHVSWKYNSEDNTYERYIAGLQQKGIATKNIIIQILPNQLIADDEKGRLSMPVIGSGKAIYFIDGEKIEGLWKKSDYGEKTMFLDNENNKIPLNKGQTWIEVVDYEQKISTK